MPFISQVQTSLAQNVPFSVCKDQKGKWSLEKMPPWKRILDWGNHGYHQNRVDLISKALFETLQRTPSLPIHEALKNPAVNVTRKFLRQFDFSQKQSGSINRCSRQLLATKLGLTLEAFDKNPGFEEFAFKSHLERYLLDYGHKIEWNRQSGELSLMCTGKYMPWSQIKHLLNEWPEPEKNFPDNPRLLWFYGNEGIQKKDMYAWKSLEPYKVVANHEWGERYLFEYCVCCGDSFQLSGDHSWIELKTPAGQIYSAGLYRPGKAGKSETVQLPMRVKKGYLMSPDVSIFWPMPIYRIPVEISKEQFHDIKRSIERDKQNEDSLCFQLFNGNCQEYVNAKAAIAGIRLPTRLNVIRQLSPILLQKAVDTVLSYLPQLVQKICHVVAAVFGNMILWLLGASSTDRQLLSRGKPITIKPQLSSFKDLFDPEKLFYHPPRYVGLVLKKKIDNWVSQAPGRRYHVPSSL